MITLICGHSRAGKTTYSKRYEGSCQIIHLDDVHSFSAVISRVRMITEDVVVEGIYYEPRDRIRLLESYRGDGSKCICLDASKEIREKRMGREIKHDFPFLIPTYDEGWDEIIVIRGQEDAEY